MRSKAYIASLPASFTRDDLGKIERWSLDNCYRAAIVHTGDQQAVWVAMREETRSKGEWLRSVRGVFNTLRLDARALGGDGWLALCVEADALERIGAANKTPTRDAAREGEATHADHNTRDIHMPSARQRGAVGRSHARTTFEVVKGS